VSLLMVSSKTSKVHTLNMMKTHVAQSAVQDGLAVALSEEEDSDEQEPEDHEDGSFADESEFKTLDEFENTVSADDVDSDDESDEEQEEAEYQMFADVENHDTAEANASGGESESAGDDMESEEAAQDDHEADEHADDEEDAGAADEPEQAMTPVAQSSFLQQAYSAGEQSSDDSAALDVSTYFLQTQAVLRKRGKHSKRIRARHADHSKKAKAHRARMGRVLQHSQALGQHAHAHGHSHAEKKVITLISRRRQQQQQHQHTQALLQQGPLANATANATATPVMSGPTAGAQKKMGKKCSMSKTPNCQKFLDAMLQMSSEVDDAIVSVNAQISKAEADCKKVEDGFNEQIRDQEA